MSNSRRSFLGQFGAMPLLRGPWAAAASQPAEAADPNPSPLDLWGWHTSPFYQRWDERVVSPAHLLTHAVEDSYKHGANLVEIYRGGYPLEQRGGWTRESTAALHRAAHDLDMLVQWFPHRLDGDAQPKAGLTNHWAEGSDVATNTFPGAVRAMRELGAALFDSLETPPEELLDVFGTEQWPVMHALLFNKCMWPYQPAMSFYTDNHAFDETLPNEIDVTASNGAGTDDQTVGYNALPSEIRKQYGLQFWGAQAECRTGIAKNRFGGLGQPDWVLKQVNDQCRERARERGRRTLSPSAIWWISEVEDMCSDANRRYVYGASQDPVRCAVTATLSGLGRDGLKVETEAGARGLPERYPYPSRTAFLQNNHLCVFALPGVDHAMLWHDPERLAHYDNDAASILLCDPFMETVAGGGPVETISAKFEHLEPAGYKAVWRWSLRLKCATGEVDETRTAEMISDAPYVRVKVERAARSTAALGARFGTPHYDRLRVGKTTYAQPTEVAPQQCFTLVDSTGRYPELAFMLLSRGAIEHVRWAPQQGLTFESRPGERETFELAVGPHNAGELFEYLSQPEERVVLDAAGGAVVSNQLGIPVVKVVRVAGAGPHPFQVNEHGQWGFRGAQPSLLHAGEDYLKCYLPAHGSARIQRYGFLEDVARPGWGCQYTMALGECWRRGQRAGVTAEVRSVTSFLFAPRVRFKTSLAEVHVNGRPWRYFDGCHVFLPNRRGSYRIEVTEGPATQPHVARTFAHIENAEWRGGQLTFEARLPEWVQGAPADFDLVALIRHPGMEVTGLDGASLLRAKPLSASIIRFKPGAISLRFAAQGNARVRRADAGADIGSHLAHRSALMLRPYLRPFECKEMALDHIGPCDVLVWNHYCLDELPETLRPAVIDNLRNHVEHGGGLLLMANAVRIAPQLMGTSTDRWRTLHIGHHLNVDCQSFNLEALVDAHPVFQGLSPRVTWIEPGPSDIFKRVLGDAPGGRALARMQVQFKPGKHSDDPIYASTPALWEWRLDQGRILACACGPRYTLGSPNRWTPPASARRLVENAVRYLGGGAPKVRVGLLS